MTFEVAAAIYILGGFFWAGLYNHFVDRVDDVLDLILWAILWPIIVLPSGIFLIALSFVQVTKSKGGCLRR